MEQFARTLAGIVIGFGLVYGATRVMAQGKDPNDVPHDPHPLAEVAQPAPEEASSAMQVHGEFIYVLRGNRVHRIPINYFSTKEVRTVELPTR